MKEVKRKKTAAEKVSKIVAAQNFSS